MANLNVYFYGGTHPIYENILKYPPKGIRYSSNLNLSDFDSLKIYSKSYETRKRHIINFGMALRLPRMIYIKEKCDVIHTSRGFLPLNRKPWVVDAEKATAFSFAHGKVNKRLVERFLSSRHCKRIMPHCIASEKSIHNFFDTSKFKEKIEVVYPGVPVNENKKIKSEKIRILYVAKRSSFYPKGGKELIKAFDILCKKYDDIELILKTDMDDSMRALVNNPNIIILDQTIPRDKLFSELYMNADIFVLPSFVDSFGYVLLEAMSSGLPIVATDIFAIPEIVEDGKNGLLVRSPVSAFDDKYQDIPLSIDLRSKYIEPIVHGLVEKLSILIEDAKLRTRMGDAGREQVESGKFSLYHRNNQLRKIYEISMRS